MTISSMEKQRTITADDLVIGDKEIYDAVMAAVEYADTRPKLGVLKLKRDKSSYKKQTSNMAEKKVLTIHLTDEWYQKIASGEKTEEYRECSLYWTVRLLRKDIPNRPDVIAGVAKYHRASDRGLFLQGYLTGGLKHTSDSPEDRSYRKEVLEPFTHVHFLLGYPKDNQPYIEKEIDEITVDKPKKGMCPDAWLKKNMFVIRFK